MKGRCPSEYVKMIEYIKGFADWSPTVSVELEKTKPELLPLASQADVVSDTCGF